MTDLFETLGPLLPSMQAWVQATTLQAEEQARPLSQVAGAPLREVLPELWLERTQIVLTEQPPVPPLAEWGVPDFLGPADPTGITFGDWVFVKQLDDSLLFHEWVHCVQWQRMGFEGFLMAYAHGLLRYGYRESPLERMAYEHQASFEQGLLPPYLLQDIEEHCDAIGAQAEAARESTQYRAR